MSLKVRRISVVLGIGAILFFTVIYGFDLLPPFGSSPVYGWLNGRLGSGAFILLNILIALAFLFLLPYRQVTTANWRSHGAFVAFIIALMTEMLGWPLLIFLVSPLVRVPILTNTEYFQRLGAWPHMVGTAVSIMGVLLIAFGWMQIHRTRALVTTGLYRYIRHPQYTGIFLFTLGWIIHWPTVITLVMWPVLIGAYIWLSISEEKQMVKEFGAAYVDYAKDTKRFIPYVI